MRFFLALCFLPGLLCAEDDWHAALHRIAHTVVEAVTKSDNYICSQDLSRFYYTALSSEAACRQPPMLPASPMRVEDRLKLDVAVSEGGEIYSWHGEQKFSAKSVSEIVRQGPISSGSFNGYLRNIFGERGVSFTYKGRAKLNDLDLFQFDYEVPLGSSHYEIEAGKNFELAPFHGSFTAKASSFELYSLSVIANGENLTNKTSICAAQTNLTYQLVKIADHVSLLPASFELLIGSRNGIFTRSKGVYSACHEYRGESTVKFDLDDDASTPTKAVELDSEPLTEGLVLPIHLQSDIDEDTAYAGLPVEAILQHDVKLKKGVKLLRGAELRGTVTEFQIFHQPAHAVAVKLEFDTITDGNKIYLCKALHRFYPALTPSYAGMGRGRRIAPPALQDNGGDEGDGKLFFEGRHLHLGKNYSTEFVTVNQTETASR